MSTHSCVAVQSPEGYFRVIYVHWDGYPKGVGAGLLKHVPTYESVNILMDQGDHSSVLARETPISYVSMGENIIDGKPTILKTIAEVQAFASEKCSARYLYVLDVFGGDGKWHVHEKTYGSWIDCGPVENLLSALDLSKN